MPILDFPGCFQPGWSGVIRHDLTRANTVVITDEMAGKYFGDEEPIGKIIEVGIEGTEFGVTGIVRKYPGNSHLEFDFWVHLNPQFLSTALTG